jgi:hypothetical protein
VFKATRTAGLPVIFCHVVGFLVLQDAERPGLHSHAERGNDKLSVVSGISLRGFPPVGNLKLHNLGEKSDFSKKSDFFGALDGLIIIFPIESVRRTRA